jgi:D-alanyl-D-alanine carboxypeptidase
MVSTAADLNSFFAALLTGALLPPAQLREMKITTATGTSGVEGGLGITRHALPDGVTVWGKDGGFHSYRTWCFHTSDASRQLTVSITVAFNDPPTTDEILSRVASLFA